MASTFRLDHVVIRVYDLASAVADYTRLGFHVVPGGEHPGLGSRNALIAFDDDTYLELIAYGLGPPNRVVPRRVRFQELGGRPAPERHWLPWEASPEGLVDFALLPSNIGEALAVARANGQRWEGPLPGSRLRPDGERVAWQMGLSEHLDLPFLCADLTPRTLRVPTGKARQHANGILGIRRLTIHVADREASAARYGALLGQEPSSQYALGGTVLSLVQAADEEGPWEIEFLDRDGAAAPQLLAGPAHGARFRVRGNI